MSSDAKIISHLQSLPTSFWDFKNENVRGYTHGFHQYPAIMVCPISRHIIQFVSEIMPINALLDPFMGSGTVLVEGILGRIPHVAGNDLNPMSVFMTRVKTSFIDSRSLIETYNELKNRYTDATLSHSNAIESIKRHIEIDLELNLFEKNEWSENAHIVLAKHCATHKSCLNMPRVKNLGYWFLPHVIYKLIILRDILTGIEDKIKREFFQLAFSECIRLVSNRRNGEFKMFRMPVEKLKSFNPDVWGLFSEIATRNIEKMEDFNKKKYKEKSSVLVNYGDTRYMENIPNTFYDLVITSPPYGDSRTTVAYGEFSRLSSSWLELSSEKEVMSLDKQLMGGSPQKKEVYYDLPSKTLNSSLAIINGVDTARCAYVYAFYRELNEAIAEISKKTKLGGYHFWVVGNRIVKKEKLLTDMILCELAVHHGLRHIITVGRAISNKVMPCRNSPTNEIGKLVETMTNEHIVVLQKC